MAIPHSHSDARAITTMALVAALLCAAAWIMIPVGAVPVTLQVFIVLLAGLVLTPKRAALAVIVYLVLGTAGVPVFAGAQGGLGILLGPTGGYLVGFAVAAPVVASVRRGIASRHGASIGDAAGVVCGVIIIYVFGWAQLAASTGMGLAPAFVAGVAPFVALDAAKGVAAVGVAAALRRAGVVVADGPGSCQSPRL